MSSARLGSHLRCRSLGRELSIFCHLDLQQVQPRGLKRNFQSAIHTGLSAICMSKRRSQLTAGTHPVGQPCSPPGRTQDEEP
eukprot:750644-Hanusia_phi.AAC.2